MLPHILPISNTGRLLVALSAQAVLKLAQWASTPGTSNIADLSQLAVGLDYPTLKSVLDQFGPPPSSRAIDSLSLSDLIHLDEQSLGGLFPPSRSLTAYWIVDTAGAEPATTQLMAQLLGVREAIAAVHREQAVGPPPAPVVDWTDDDHAHQQSHLDPAPTGIDAKWVWDQLGLHGTGIDFVDVEMGWNLNHEDLIGKAPTRLTPAGWDNPEWDDHGTSVLGLVAGMDNDKGIVGIAPGVNSVRVASHWNGMVNTKVANAIATAASALASGDVLLIEAQTEGFWPIELLTGDLELNAIKAATNKGIIVVEAAGNRGVDMDLWITDWSGPYDSGAIMVGASTGDPPAAGTGAIPHAPLSTSNVSVRLDCFAQGVELVSSGDGDLADLGVNATYTARFGETSGASAIIAGAAILAQHMHVHASGTRLDGAGMRTLLSDPNNGTPQGAPGLGNLGTMPDLRRVAASLIDVYLRDNAADAGVEPSTGPLSSSPDVFVVPAIVADAQGDFGEGSGSENSTTLGQAVTGYADHQVYTRVRNLGRCPAKGVRVTAYWSEVATLVTPASWTMIGTSMQFDVPANNALTVAPPIPWLAAQIPAPGHYCFVAEVDHAYDPAPGVPGPTDWNGFLSYLRGSNNVTWRNFNVLDEDELSAQSGAWFWMQGAPDQARRFDFEIIQRLPRGARLYLDIPLALAGAIRGPFLKDHRIDGDEQRVMITLPAEPRLHLPRVRLGCSARYRCRFVLLPADRSRRVALGRAFGSIAIRQIYEGQEVGRITWMLRSTPLER